MPPHPPKWIRGDFKSLARYVWAEPTAAWAGLAQDGADTFHDLRQSNPRKLAAILYRKLASLRIPYELGAIDFQNHHINEQVIRVPWELQQTGGNCLDLTVMYAALCEAAQLRPLIVLLEGHALIAIWLKGDLTAFMGAPGRTPNDHRFLDQGIVTINTGKARQVLLDLAEAREYLLVESTGFARSAQHSSATGQLTFDEACEAALDRTRKLNLVNIVDVAFLHHHGNSYKPYPVTPSASRRHSSVVLGQWGASRVRDMITSRNLSLRSPAEWTGSALRELSEEASSLPAHFSLELTHVFTSLAAALEATETAREAIPHALSPAILVKALARVQPAGSLPHLIEDVDFFSYVALNTPLGGLGPRQNLASYLLHIAALGDQDLNAVMPWAQSAGQAFANDQREQLAAWQKTTRLRLIISLHASATGTWTAEPQAWLLDRAELAADPEIIRCSPTQSDNEAAVLRLLRWGYRKAAALGETLRHVDIVPPARHVLTWTPHPVLTEDHDTVTRWSYRLNPPPHLMGGLFRAVQRQENVRGGGESAPVDWFTAEAATQPGFNATVRSGCTRAIGLTFHPRGRQRLLEDLLDNTPVLLWPEEGHAITPEICGGLAQRWPTLPRGFARAKRAGPLAGISALWDDRDWLDFCLLYV